MSTNWTPDLRESAGPIYLALAEALDSAIRQGKLAAGDRLPTQKDLAQRLSIDITTVTRAYAQVAQAGLIESGGRRGSFVKGAPTPVPPTVETTVEDLSNLDALGLNMPPEPAGGVLGAALKQGFDQIFAHPNALPVHYQPSGGMELARRGAAERLSFFLPPTNPDQIVITAGAQNAIHAICGALLRPGDVVAAGEYTYPGFLSVARQLNARIAPVAMDGEGILPDALEAVAKAHALVALFVVPTNDNPTTATLSVERRKAIADLAERYGFAIIEDDAYGALAAKRPAPITAFAPTRSWFISSLSKAVSPFFRSAAVRAPSVRDSIDLAADVHNTVIMAPPLSGALMDVWIKNGTMFQLTAAVREESIARQALARDILGPERFVAQPEGYHLWIPLPDGPGGADTISTAGFSGLPVVPASWFAVQPTGLQQSLRVSLGGARSRERITRDLGRLDAILSRRERRRVNFA